MLYDSFVFCIFLHFQSFWYFAYRAKTSGKGEDSDTSKGKLIV